MKITAPARSDQINADDFVGGPEVFTIAGVSEGKAEQRYDIALEETPGKAWRPPLTVLRLLIAAWGDESTRWVGRRVMLYRDETVMFGKDSVGGIRVLQMSDLPNNEPFETKVMVSRGRRVKVHIEPLTEAAPAPTPSPTAQDVAECNDVEALRAMWKAASPEVQELIKARVDELNGASE